MIKHNIFVGGALTLLVGITSAEACETIQECAQEAVEAAMTANSRIDLMLPTGAVVAFALEQCPTPFWEEYQPAYGRFVRGVDRSNNPIDPDGDRAVGSFQDHALQAHTHTHTRIDLPCNDCGLPNKSEDNDGRFMSASTSEPIGANVNDQETRPSNVALLYCIRK